MKRFLFLIPFLFLADVARSAVVEGVNNRHRRVLLLLDRGETGIFSVGDQVRLRVKSRKTSLKGTVVRKFSPMEVAVKIVGSWPMPRRGQSFDVIPTYHNRRVASGIDWRSKAGTNRFGERFFAAVEAGNAAREDMIGVGGRFGFFVNNKMAFSLLASQGSLANDKVLADSQMASLRLTAFPFGGGFNGFFGVGSRRTDVRKAPLPEDEKKAQEDQSQSQTSTIDDPLDAKEPPPNYAEDHILEFGFGYLLSAETNNIGNVFMIGADIAALQMVVGNGAKSKNLDRELEKAYSLNSSQNIYSRLYLGFSF